MNIGDKVRIVEDEYPELVGVIGTIEKISDDGTVAWVVRHSGIWCSLSNLEKVNDDED